MFETEGFIDSCRTALKDTDPRAAIEELVARTVKQPGLIMHALGEPKRASVNVIYKAEDLTILNLCWGPRLQFHPHDHRMWAVIGIYAGREQNFFYQRSGQGLQRHGMRELDTGDTTRLGRDVIHAVTNPLDQITAAIHVYGGDFFGTPRSEWDPQTFQERPYDTAAAMRIFEESNARLSASA